MNAIPSLLWVAIFAGVMACLQGCAISSASSVAQDTISTSEAPQIFSPGVISGPSNDADPAFTPDGRTVIFSRDGALMVSMKGKPGWSSPEIAPFSGQWMDAQPTMAPDGSFLVFVSNRPVAASDATHPSGNLWRVDRAGGQWGSPLHLPAAVNRTQSIWGPSVARDGSLWFMDRMSNGKGPFRLWRSQATGREYLAAVPISFGDPTTQDVDPSVAPDESFVIFASKQPGTNAHERLFISFKSDAGGWGPPIDLGNRVNGTGSNDCNEARLGPDGQTLYFSTDRMLPISYPRSHIQALADLDRIASWDNGNANIWSTSLFHVLPTRRPAQLRLKE